MGVVKSWLFTVPAQTYFYFCQAKLNLPSERQITSPALQKRNNITLIYRHHSSEKIACYQYYSQCFIRVFLSFKRANLRGLGLVLVTQAQKSIQRRHAFKVAASSNFSSTVKHFKSSRRPNEEKFIPFISHCSCYKPFILHLTTNNGQSSQALKTFNSLCLCQLINTLLFRLFVILLLEYTCMLLDLGFRLPCTSLCSYNGNSFRPRYDVQCTSFGIRTHMLNALSQIGNIFYHLRMSPEQEYIVFQLANISAS